MSTSQPRFSIFSFSNKIKALKEKCFIRKTKGDIWAEKLHLLVRDMKHVIEGAKDAENLSGGWPGGHVRVERFIGIVLKYIEVIDMDGCIPRSYLKHLHIELDLGLDAMEIYDIDSINGVDAKDENTIGV